MANDKSTARNKLDTYDNISNHGDLKPMANHNISTGMGLVAQGIARAICIIRVTSELAGKQQKASSKQESSQQQQNGMQQSNSSSSR